jgi:pyruvate ferredoxin oxidoreductase alpha subunit
VLGLTCFRPWPREAMRAALHGARRVLVLEKSLGVGVGGIVAANVRDSYAGSSDCVHTVIAGLGGRNITRQSLQWIFEEALRGDLGPLTFLDLDHSVVERVLAREREVRRSGPIPEGILRDRRVTGDSGI